MSIVLKINHEKIAVNLKEDEKREFGYNHSSLINWR